MKKTKRTKRNLDPLVKDRELAESYLRGDRDKELFNNKPIKAGSRAHKVLLEMTAPPRPVTQPSKKVIAAMRKKGIIMTNAPLGEIPEKSALKFINSL